MPIPLAYQTRLMNVPGVREVMVANWFQGTYKDNRDPKNQFARFSVEPEKLFKVYGEWRIPEPFVHQDVTPALRRNAFERNGASGD